MSHGKTDQNMVPKSTNEVKERAACSERDKRASSPGAGGAGQDEAATAGEAGEAREPAPRPPRDPPPRPDEDAHRQGLQRYPQSE